jgi:hypothetical protein
LDSLEKSERNVFLFLFLFDMRNSTKRSSDCFLSIAEHRSSRTIGISYFNFEYPKLLLATFHDSLSFFETLSQITILTFSSINITFLISSNSSGSPLISKIVNSFKNEKKLEIVEIPRSNFDENLGMILLKDYLTKNKEELTKSTEHSSFKSISTFSASIIDIESSENFLAVASANALLKYLESEILFKKSKLMVGNKKKKKNVIELRMLYE